LRITLDETYCIDFDGNCFQLLEKKVITGEGRGAKKVKAENIGQTREQCLGYYGKLSDALMGYMKQEIHAESLETMEMIMEFFETFYDRLDAVFKPIGYDIKKLYAEQKEREAAKKVKPAEAAPETEAPKEKESA